MKFTSGLGVGSGFEIPILPSLGLHNYGFQIMP